MCLLHADDSSPTTFNEINHLGKEKINTIFKPKRLPAGEVRQVIPRIKIIVTLRNPTDRSVQKT
jgi:hypothetical protein